MNSESKFNTVSNRKQEMTSNGFSQTLFAAGQGAIRTDLQRERERQPEEGGRAGEVEKQAEAETESKTEIETEA